MKCFYTLRDKVTTEMVNCAEEATITITHETDTDNYVEFVCGKHIADTLASCKEHNNQQDELELHDAPEEMGRITVSELKMVTK